MKISDLRFTAFQGRLKAGSAPGSVTTGAVYTETIGRSTLRVYEGSTPGGTKFTIERTATHADGAQSLRVNYGQNGFSSIDEALEFGREWCRVLGDH